MTDDLLEQARHLAAVEIPDCIEQGCSADQAAGMLLDLIGTMDTLAKAVRPLMKAAGLQVSEALLTRYVETQTR